MRKVFEYHTSNLSQYPTLHKASALTQFTEGDLHANTIRLIESLVHYAVVSMRQDDYTRLLRVYEHVLKHPEESKYNKEVVELIQKIEIRNPAFFIRLIGDTLADRTGNDLFTLTLFDHLLRNHCHLRILMSNHDIQFMIAVMQATNLHDLKHISQNNEFFSVNNQGVSFVNLVKSVENNEISFDKLKSMAKRYFSTLLLLDYAVDAHGELEIFSHAPINLKTLKALGEQFGVPYPGDHCRIEERIAFINGVNTIFRAYVEHGNANILENLFNREDQPTFKVIWQREMDQNYTFIDTRLPIINIYGHDRSLDDTMLHGKKIIRLDNEQGKGSLRTRGETPTSWATNSSVSIAPRVTDADIQKALFVYKKQIYKIATVEDLKELKEDMIQEIQALERLATHDPARLNKTTLILDIDLINKLIVNFPTPITDAEFDAHYRQALASQPEDNSAFDASKTNRSPLQTVLSHSEVKKVLVESNFNSAFDAMKKQIAEEPESPSCKAERKLYETLSDNKRQFLKTGKTDEFVEHSMSALKKHEPKIKQHSAWKQIFFDLLNALIFIASLSISYWVTGKFRLFSIPIESTEERGMKNNPHTPPHPK